MSFITSIVLLAALACGVAVPMFLGHALSTGVAAWYLAAGAALVASAIFLFIVKAMSGKRGLG